MVLLKLCKHILDGLCIFGRIFLVQTVYGLQCLLYSLAVAVGQILVVHQAVERSHAHTEELVEVVAVYAKERESFEQRHVGLLSLLKDAVVEVHPADVAFGICRLLCHNNI